MDAFIEACKKLGIPGSSEFCTERLLSVVARLPQQQTELCFKE
jgi:hypothetical protein